MSRVLDIIAALLGFLVVSPFLLPVIFLIWKQDYQSPFYISPRVGKGEKLFNSVKLRSMIVDADKSNVDSTSANDLRITPIGHFLRRYKLDELTQLWNVLLGDMSCVGPRPNVQNETDLYTAAEKKLLSVRPGITDFSSIIFSDEGEILENKEDPNLSYNQLIRPWKSRLGLVYIDNQSILLDFQLIIYTLVAIVYKQKAIKWVVGQLESMEVDPLIVKVSRRTEELYPYPPPGMEEIVVSR